ncbi:YkuS family protein [Bacillaceae bacterium W0354]
MAKIAVESNMTDVMDALKEAGHEVVALEGDNAANCDCCCISGQDQNVMGMSTATTDAPVVNCDGMTADQVVQEVNNRVQA